jgi:hypothetical protein
MFDLKRLSPTFRIYGALVLDLLSAAGKEITVMKGVRSDDPAEPFVTSI